jgi:hypothetical protein
MAPRDFRSHVSPISRSNRAAAGTRGARRGDPLFHYSQFSLSAAKVSPQPIASHVRDDVADEHLAHLAGKPSSDRRESREACATRSKARWLDRCLESSESESLARHPFDFGFRGTALADKSPVTREASAPGRRRGERSAWRCFFRCALPAYFRRHKSFRTQENMFLRRVAAKSRIKPAASLECRSRIFQRHRAMMPHRRAVATRIISRYTAGRLLCCLFQRLGNRKASLNTPSEYFPCVGNDRMIFPIEDC